MNTELRPLIDHGLQESVALLNLGFSDYLVNVQLTIPIFLNMVRAVGLDLSASRVIFSGDEAVGAALIGRRGWTSRLGGMSIVPNGRGQGIGRKAMDLLLEEASRRGDHRMVLEVIEQNHPAVRLYERCGFTTDRRLVAYEGIFNDPQGEASLDEVDIREAARLVTLYGLENLPWQISGESLAHFNPPGKAYQLGDAYLVITDPSAEPIRIRSLIVLPAGRSQGHARRIIQTAVSRHPGKTWLVPALCPAEIGGLFEKVGFTPGKLSQLQMGIEIAQP